MTEAELQEITTKDLEATEQEGGPPKEIDSKNRNHFQREAESWKKQEVGKTQIASKEFWTDGGKKGKSDTR